LIIQLAEKFNIPVLLTPMAKGLFPENHPLYAGVLFHALSNYVAETYREADLVIGIGYDPVEFNYEEWMPRVPLIHFDSQPADIDREEYPEVIEVTGNLNDLLERFLSFHKAKKRIGISRFLRTEKKKVFRNLTPVEGSFGPLSVVDELRNALPEDGILTVDVGVASSFNWANVANSGT
jgi:acetolactate synthase I/II/III large subunit